MSKRSSLFAGFGALLISTTSLLAQDICQNFGPQTPRDISSAAGTNIQLFSMARPSTEMNLCNIHTHTNAEHKGPGFLVSAGDGVHGGFKCNETADLTAAELAMPEGEAKMKNVKPGDTIEVHWVHSSCQVKPGKGLDACSIEGVCVNPTLRVETQVFLVVNDDTALDFNSFGFEAGDSKVNGVYQPKALPTGTGEPVQFQGSTTGSNFSQSTCSPLQVTWSVRPQCAKVSYASLNEWAANDNVFDESKSQQVRPLVTAPELLSQINN